MVIEGMPVGKTATFSKTVGETDVLMFAGISGDFAPIHVDEEFAKSQGQPGRIAHGALMVAYMTAASTKILEGVACKALSQGYDRMRFTKPVSIGDTVTVTYRVAEIDDAKSRTIADITITNQKGETVAVARHIMKYL